MSLILDKKVKNVFHVGAYKGEEMPLYVQNGAEKIVWVEANPVLYSDLILNCNNSQYENLENICFNYLISDRDDIETDFHLYYAGDNLGMSSIFEKTSGSAGKEDAEFNKRFHNGTLKLKSITVDTLLEKHNLGYDFDMLTMDVQGAELLVLNGAKKLLENVKYINSEITLFAHDYDGGVYFDELYSFLKKFGFVHVNNDLCGDGSWGDAFFIKK